ncbi:ATP-binding protein [Limnoglobus roseus]|uniref:histidine kinase n=1 Tax=Limnoglobus roseus TaxID=2598579 RepID=A0A5C1ALA8_9BACT|nr:ATP-binding protein [Limnoglobus roseus]QEL19730.1 HAMP domain-containing protein [Limnoglobus roseus]
MSYRGFKRLLGETGLERKCRYLLGAGVILLMSVSFVVYARQTEELAYDQLQNTGQTLAPTVVARHHTKAEFRDTLDRYQRMAEDELPPQLKSYKYKLSSINPTDNVELQPTSDELPILQNFQLDPTKTEYSITVPAERVYVYYAPVRAGRQCVECHRSEKSVPKPVANLKEGDILGMVSVRMSTELIETGFHQNRALLIAFAIGTTVLILAGSYLIIRYVIVKPVKHLKDVSEAIASGELNVRSEIQTGDEFEDLSIAFNRMLRNLTSMQDRNRGLISDLDRKVDELARVNMALYESNRLKGDFLSTMSHELRTPLNSIIGFSEVLLNAGNLSDKQHRYAGNIMTSGQQLLALINDVLDLAKAESGKMRFHPETVHAAELCEQLLALHKPAAEKKNVELRLSVPPDLPAVRQDVGKLRQILANLISNAIKFTPEGGRVTLAASVVGGELVLTVEDTGVGIADEEQDSVFDKFRQSANPLTREQGGTGLGLSIVKELTKLLGGDVTLKSELGRGSTFTVRVTTDLKEEPLLAFDLPGEGR